MTSGSRAAWCVWAWKAPCDRGGDPEKRPDPFSLPSAVHGVVPRGVKTLHTVGEAKDWLLVHRWLACTRTVSPQLPVVNQSFSTGSLELPREKRARYGPVAWPSGGGHFKQGLGERLSRFTRPVASTNSAARRGRWCKRSRSGWRCYLPAAVCPSRGGGGRGPSGNVRRCTSFALWSGCG